MNTKTLLVQAALAGLLAAASSPVRAGDKPAEKPKAAKKAGKAAEKVHCMGVNACKGKSECAVEGKSSCAGQNSCKGQGWVSLTKKACKKKKGAVVPSKS